MIYNHFHLLDDITNKADNFLVSFKLLEFSLDKSVKHKRWKNREKVPGPARDPSIVNSASTPLVALARPFPVRTTFWSPALPVLLTLLARDLLCWVSASNAVTEAMANTGEWGSGILFQVNLRAYSPISWSKNLILVRWGIGVSFSVSTVPEGPVISALNVPVWWPSTIKMKQWLKMDKTYRDRLPRYQNWSSLFRPRYKWVYSWNRLRIPSHQ